MFQLNCIEYSFETCILRPLKTFPSEDIFVIFCNLDAFVKKIYMGVACFNPSVQ